MSEEPKVALITGITGQDGSYLAEFLLEKGYVVSRNTRICFRNDLLGHSMSLTPCGSHQVHGIIRRSSSFNTGRIDHIYRDRHETGVKLFLHYGDLCDATNLITIISQTRPTEIYNLGAMSHVKVSIVSGE